MANPHTIAVAGKGGVGKTTTCGMLIDYLCKKNKGPVLVVDADANSNLNEVLGVEVETSLGAIREEIAQAELKGTIPASMTKADYADFKFNSALIEDDDFDMLVMGRTQGKAATASSTASCSASWTSMHTTIPTLSWTTRQASSTWHGVPCPMWTPCC